MKVFWPTSGIERDSGFVVGWRVEDTLCVVGIVEDWLAEHVRTHAGEVDIDIGNGRRLEILGQARTTAGTHDSAGSEHEDPPMFWLHGRGRQLISCSLQAPQAQLQVISYVPPDHDRLRFLALSRNADGHNGVDEQLAAQDVYSVGPRLRTDHNGEKAGKGLMEEIIPLLNAAKKAQQRLRHLSLDQARALSASARVPRTYDDRQPTPKPAFIASLVRLLLLPLGLIVDSILGNLSYVPHPYIGSMSHHSLLLKQLSLRLDQTRRGPERFVSTRESGIDIQTRSKRYMKFWNTVWLVINDIILGYCAKQAILQSAEFIRPLIAPILRRYAVDYIVQALRWLNNWPVGLKLNTPLSQFFCTSFETIISTWGDILTPILDAASSLILCSLAAISLGGLTFLLAGLHDALRILTAHLSICGTIMGGIFRWQLNSLGALWNLFRGKRWNVLRQRTDSYAYDVDQLFLGTLLFTVSSFLFPTVLTYFALFALIRSVVACACKTIKVGVMALNAFPLFELMLRLKEPSRLPAGVHFHLQPVALHEKLDSGALYKQASRISHVLELKNSPKSITDTFRQSFSL